MFGNSQDMAIMHYISFEFERLISIFGPHI